MSFTIAIFFTYVLVATLVLLHHKGYLVITDLFTRKRSKWQKIKASGVLLQFSSKYDENGSSGSNSGELAIYREMYHKVQNLEQFSEIIPQARDLLTSMLSKALGDAIRDPNSRILSISNYTTEAFSHFLQETDQSTTDNWEQYLTRRRKGLPRDLFETRDQAIFWLKRNAPIKFVDGAWLGHINKVTTPFSLRGVTKDAWQVISEELGDGDVTKNHVYVYNELLKSVGVKLPRGDRADFTSTHHGMDDVRVWKAAVAQLLISLFPHDFLPEILGFNVHYELLALETLKASKELQELRIDAYYFILHVTIDNADSGHTAMAAQAVNKFIEHVRTHQGKSMAQQAWRRVQAGYLLSESLSADQANTSKHKRNPDQSPSAVHEAHVIRIFEAKAPVAHKIHCSSKMKIGRRTLVDWLDPSCFTSREWQKDFLNDLANCNPWIRKGDGKSSKLIKELQWGGKMFGAFTHNEIKAVEKWIDSLAIKDEEQVYHSLLGQTLPFSQKDPSQSDIRANYPVFSPIAHIDLPATDTLYPEASLSSLDSRLPVPTKADATSLLPLWFTHPSLLQTFVCVPARTTTPTACAIVRLLRAQSGFNPETPFVDGMDEVRRSNTVGLIEIGCEIAERSGHPVPDSVKQALEWWPSRFAVQMLHLSMRPVRNGNLLLGLAWAFTQLHASVAASSLVSEASGGALVQIAEREQAALQVCWKEIKDNGEASEEFRKGYAIGRAQIAGCFRD